MNNETHVNWGGKSYPIAYTKGVTHFFKVSVNDALDNYTSQPINSLKNFGPSIA